MRPDESGPASLPKLHPRHGLWYWLTCAAIVLCLLVLLSLALLAANWPFTKQAVVDALQESSKQYITIDRFHRTYFPPGCISEGVRTVSTGHAHRPPLISMQRLVVQGSYKRLLLFQKHLSLVRVEGLRLTIPPKGPHGGPITVMPITQAKSGRHMVIGAVQADGAILDFLPGEPENQPFRLLIDKLKLEGLGTNQPISYRATIINPKPAGEIRSSGHFGPWNPDDPGGAAVSGSYTLQNGDLAFLSKIRGDLSSSGNFRGVLSHIEVAGTTDVPDFHVTDTSHTRDLAAEFHAVVDATDGNTSLENVIAHFDQTTIASTGRVTGENGKVASLDIFSSDGEIEDLLDLVISAKRPPMRGKVSFHAHVEIPSAADSFIRKLKLVGDFGIGGGKFTNPKTQGSVGKLSASAEEKKNPDAHEEDPATVLSNLKGHVTVQDGIATLTNLSFSVPGAYAEMHGTYNLVDYTVDLHGRLITRGKIGKATSGIKSAFVDAIAPLFRKKRSLKIIPFKITGSYHHTMVALDLDAKNQHRKHGRHSA